MALRREVESASALLGKTVKVPLKSCQAVALTSLLSDLCGGYAAGKVNWDRSELCAAVNRKCFQLAAAEFFQFAYYGTTIEKRLWEKRNCEQILFRRGKIIFPLTNEFKMIL